MKEKLMTPQGVTQLNTAHGGYENAQTLLAAQLWEDALACLVLDSSPKQTVGWILQQIQRTGNLSEAECACAAGISGWLAGTDDRQRHAIFSQAEILGFDTPLGALGLAVFWSEGSMAPDEFEAVFPPPHLAPLMLHCALKLLSVSLAGDGAPQAGVETLLAQWPVTRGAH